jgi:hypothetical protein
MTDLRQVDPRLYDMAVDFLMAHLEAEALPDRELEQLARRATLAMQQAIEAELVAMRKELQA